MKKTIQPIFFVLVVLTVLSGGCAPASTPVPPTYTPTVNLVPTATATPIPSPTEVTLVWKASPLIDSPFIYSEKQGFYRSEEIYGSGVAFDTDTRWAIDVKVDNRGKDVGEASTGVYLAGHTESGNVQTFFLVYQFGKWSIGYRPIQSEANFTYWQTFENLTTPTQSFELSISHDGKNISLKNAEGFEFHQTVSKLFDGAQAIMAGTQTGPRTEITLSKLVVEQLENPSESTISTINLETPYIVSFENLDVSNPAEISPFRFPPKVDILNLFQWWAIEEDYTSWAVDSRALSGKVSLNVIPNGNPATRIRPTTPRDTQNTISVAILNPVFNVSGYSTIDLKMSVNSTSNPDVKDVQNCGSDLHIFYKIDSGKWISRGVMCGEHKTESQGWVEKGLFVDFDVTGKSTIQFAFSYEVQNVKEPDPTVYFLIDDLEITAK